MPDKNPDSGPLFDSERPAPDALPGHTVRPVLKQWGGRALVAALIVVAAVTGWRWWQDRTVAVTDEQAHALAKNLRLKIEQELDYPSTIKVTVIREQRYTETAT